MKKQIISAVLLGMLVVPSYATVYDLEVAMNNVRESCVGISSKMDHLKTMAGISTGIGAVGTAVGAGALASGIVKSQTDAEIEDLLKKLAEKLKKAEKVDDKELDDVLADLKENWETYSEEYEKETKKIDELEKKSKTLGDVRTGLLATNTATSVAGAVVSSKSKVSGSLKDRIDECVAATEDLRESMMQARLEGQDTTKAKRIVDACSEYKTADVSKVNKLATGSTVTSSIGAVVGGVGMITSIAANTDATRNDDTKEGKEKEKGLNTASNVLSGITTAASATSTVLSGVQIATIKKVVSVADNCEKELR